MGNTHPLAGSTNENCAICVRDSDCAACFIELMARLQVSLLCYLQRTLSREDAEDVLQETFLTGYRNIEKYDPTWSFATWIFTIAHRQAVSSRRKKSLKSVADLSAADEIPGGIEGPLTNAAETEMRDSLWAQAKEILDPDAFTALWLTYVNGMSAAQIGMVIDRSANAVRLLLSRSRTQLAEKLPANWHAHSSK